MTTVLVKRYVRMLERFIFHADPNEPLQVGEKVILRREGDAQDYGQARVVEEIGPNTYRGSRIY